MNAPLILLAFLILGCVMAFPILLIVLIVLAILKKPVKKTAFAVLGSFLGIIAFSITFGILYSRTVCDHEYEIIDSAAPTCTAEGFEVKQCLKCQDRQTEPFAMLPHDWVEADCKTPKTCSVCGMTEGAMAGHSWQDATCAAPKTCSVCGMTEGATADHSWQDATCSTPKTCSVCGMTEGEALSPDGHHSWLEATCTSPKICSVCGAVGGTATPHQLGEWVVTEEATLEKQGTRQQSCTVCQAVINTEKFDSPYKIIPDKINQIVSNRSGKTSELGVFPFEKEEGASVTGAIYCENSEKEVEVILSTSLYTFPSRNL